MASQISTTAKAEVSLVDLHLIVVYKRSIREINALQSKNDATPKSRQDTSKIQISQSEEISLGQHSTIALSLDLSLLISFCICVRFCFWATVEFSSFATLQPCVVMLSRSSKIVAVRSLLPSSCCHHCSQVPVIMATL